MKRRILPSRKKPLVTSRQHQIIVAYMRVTKQTKTSAESLNKPIQVRQKGGRPDPSNALKRRMNIERCDKIGFPVYMVRPLQGDSGRRIVYTHGGSYVHTLAKQHWTLAATLADRLAATVIVPDHLLAPEHTWRESFPGMVDLARWAVDDATSGCTLMGDSSGGGYTLAVAQQLSATGTTSLPLVLIAPFVDLTMTNPRSGTIDPPDPWHSVEGLRRAGQLWAGEDDPKRPEVSPLFGSFAGLGPLLIFSGTRDVLNPQSRDLVEKARSSGVSVEFIEGANLIHDYPLLPIPEARPAVDRIVDFIVRLLRS
jgi:monoterpene epsilon-lactone hydrolase